MKARGKRAAQAERVAPGRFASNYGSAEGAVRNISDSSPSYYALSELRHEDSLAQGRGAPRLPLAMIFRAFGAGCLP